MGQGYRHSGRSVGFTGYIGGVAVFDRALTPAQMVRLADIHRSGVIEVVGDRLEGATQ